MRTSAATGPLLIGLLNQGDPGKASAGVGVSNGNTFTGSQAQHAVVDAINKSGGIAGRKLTTVEYTLEPSAPDYESALAQACTKFTQDNHVAVVLYASSFSASFASCMNKAAIPVFQSSQDAADTHDIAAYPWAIYPSAPSTQRRASDVIRAALAQHWLSRGDKLGVIVANCPGEQRAYREAEVPLLAKVGVTPVSYNVDCFTGYSSLAGLANQLANAVLKFNTSGVTKVQFLTNLDAATLLVFAQAADSQGFRPTYLLTSSAAAAAEQGNFSAGQLAGMRGLGWAPGLDISDNTKNRTIPQEQCLSWLRGSGIRPQGGGVDYFFAYAACDGFLLLQAVMSRTGGSSDGKGVLNAALALGKNWHSAAAPSAYLSTSHRDGVDLQRTFAYSPSCSCFSYTGGPANYDG